MGNVEGTAWCPKCDAQRMTRRKGTNHVLHLILTVLTLGLWGIVWIVVALNNRSGAQRCTVCGAGLSRHTQTPHAPAHA